MSCRHYSIGAPRLAAIAGVALLLAGCSTTGVRYLASEAPTDYRQRHPISLKEGQRTVRLFVGSNRGGLTPAQRADVTSFAMAWKRESTSGIVVDVPKGTSNGRAARDSLREIHSILTAAGVPKTGVFVRPYRPLEPGKLAAIRLRYAKIIAEAGPCGLWPHDLGLSYGTDSASNREYWNFGCASQRNFAAMIDNPADLVQPRGATPAYTPRRTEVLGKYRKGQSTATNYPNANQGKISDVGK